MATTTIFTRRVVLDKDFKELPEGTQVTKENTFVIKSYKYSQTYGIKSKEMEQKYVIAKGDRTFAFEQVHFEEFKKQNKLNADEIIEAAINKSPNDKTILLSKSKFKAFREGLAILFVVMIFVTGIAFFFQVSEKNFKTETKEFTQNSNVSLGDYVSAKTVILDYITIEVTTTRSNYGVKTGESKSEGNTYVLMGHAEGGSETFLYRFDPKTDEGRKFQTYMDNLANTPDDELAFEDFFYSDSLKGEVAELTKVERLDSGEQITPTLNATADTFEMARPVYLIDGRVQQLSIVPVIIITAVLGVLTLLCLVGSIFSHVKFRSATKKQVSDLFGNQSGPVI